MVSNKTLFMHFPRYSCNFSMLTIIMITDPLPPKNLRVNKQWTTTTSVEVQWDDDHLESYIKYWEVRISDVDGTNDRKVTETASRSDVVKTVDRLNPGKNYTVSVYGSIDNNRRSQAAATIKVTASKSTLIS